MRKILASAAAALMMAAATPAWAETIRWVRSSDALTLDPHAQNEGTTHGFNAHIYEPLVMRAADGSLAPRLATRWGMLESDPTVWEFIIREGVKFHDGTPLTADDVVFSLNRAMTPTSANRAFLSTVAEVRQIDDHTVHVQLNGTSPIFPSNLTNIFIMSRAWAEANGSAEPQDVAGGKDNFATRNANGTGAYKLVSREPDVRSDLTINEDHWAETRPQVTEIVYLTISDAATRVAALLSKQADIVQDVPVQDIERLSGTDGIKVVTGPENRIMYFGYNLASDELPSSSLKGRNPFQDVRVREAMSLALDRDAIKSVVMRGQSLPTGVPVPPFVNGWTPELDAYPAPDMARARELLAEAGLPDGFDVTLDCTNDRYVNDEGICQAFVGMLGQIGIKVTLASQSRTLVFPKFTNWDTDFFLFGAGAGTYDSAYLFDVLYHTREGAYGSHNASRWSNPEVDAKIEALGTEIDIEKRDAMLKEVWQTIKDETIVIPVHNQVLAYAMRDNVTLAVHPENQPNMETVTLD